MAITQGRFFVRVGRTRLIPLYLKIVLIFVFLLLISNFTTNYINLMMNRAEILRLGGELLTKELKELYVFASNQYEIYLFDGDEEEALQTLSTAASANLQLSLALAFGITEDGQVRFAAWKGEDRVPVFEDLLFVQRWNDRRKEGVEDGEAHFVLEGRSYFGFYRYNPSWELYVVRAEEESAFYSRTWTIFLQVGAVILVLTLATLWLGIFLLRHLFRYVDVITRSLYEMQKSQELSLIDLRGAPNDDVTYLGMSFNSLSTTIKNLMNIFKKFVTKDVVIKAYRERHVSLEGTQKELTILFSDIKGFTYMTETLGTDIINLLNLHYDRAIRLIQANDGIIGSIIGDALLAVFGTLEGTERERSLKALRSAYHIQDVADELRKAMAQKKEDLLREKGSLTPEEEAVFKAVLLEVGVGIDCGTVFYGRIGSYVHMTNTVIGDNVNSASRLEGLTRVYRVPVIVSEQVKDEVESVSRDEFVFQELDTVQVKGKTSGKKVFWPLRAGDVHEELRSQLREFQASLEAYYQGDWKLALKGFEKCGLPIAEVFQERIKNLKNPPPEWRGIWTMTSK